MLYADVISFFITKKCQKIQKIDKKQLLLMEKILISSERLEEFKRIFRKDVTYDNIKSHKKPGFQYLQN